MNEPNTPEEWQDAVDAAYAALALDSAAKYGLILTPIVAVAVPRCEEILERGAALGYTPATDAVERFVAELAREGQR